MIADGVVHGIGLAMAIPVGSTLRAFAAFRTGPWEFVATLLYVASLLALLSISFAYNLWPISPTKWMLRRLDHAAIDQVFVDPGGEIEEIAECAAARTRRQNRCDRALPGALDCSQAVADRLHVDRLESPVAGIDVRGLHAEAKRLAVLDQVLDLVGVVLHRGQVGGHECEIGRASCRERVL